MAGLTRYERVRYRDGQTVYFVGGFGDEHYIGYVPLKMYQEALKSDIDELGVAGRFLVDQQGVF
ncbi:hypothetical protein TRAPUB_13017 [Trametes pubescens]|uniref:Uncharacterized protein n=1 Tax=Trametes pubescens TaxID=154538 RepID=A0A1M2VS77_TRAPU|nr:hypothetical protein TRAPUB_13017 [Trametes pubescens]